MFIIVKASQVDKLPESACLNSPEPIYPSEDVLSEETSSMHTLFSVKVLDFQKPLTTRSCPNV